MTLVVPPGERVRVDDYGNYHVELGLREHCMSRDPFTLEIVKDALVAIGQEMFDAMIRTSMSPDRLRDDGLRGRRDRRRRQPDRAGKWRHRLPGNAGYRGAVGTCFAIPTPATCSPAIF